MSSSIAIPKPKKNKQAATTSSSCSPASSAGASFQYGASASTSSASSPSSSTPAQHPHSYFTRRPSMLNIFLPSYADYDTSDIDRRPDPVDEITLTDEEIADMFPQPQRQHQS
ncbi:uncharacterized protein J3D65DRAFT_670458 [Phyllosticta citribraziliensis]|uniref:Uncharacterized protein n=1 Tax=Phyllosticta citribraziliensis TaxID=989973 RepID=A0ABR1LDC6_9PEZI